MEELLAAASTVETLFPATTANPSTKINKNAAILDKILRFIPFPLFPGIIFPKSDPIFTKLLFCAAPPSFICLMNIL